MRGPAAVARRAQVPRSDIALVAVPRLRAAPNAALLVRATWRLTAATTAASGAPTAPIRCGIDTVEIARIERLLAETPPRDLTKLFSAQELDDSGERRRTRGEPRRALRGEGGVRQAVSARARGRATSSPPTFRSCATVTARRRSSAARTRRAILDQARIAGIARFADARPHAAPPRWRSRCRWPRAVPLAGQAPVRPAAVSARASSLENLRRVFGAAVPTPEIERLAQAHYAHLWQLIVRVLPLPLAFRCAQARAGARREPRSVRRRIPARQRRARADRPFRQLGSRDGRRHPELSGGARPLPFRAPADQAALARSLGHAALQHAPASA